MKRYELLLSFDTDEPEFVRGFEAGRLWAQLRCEPDREFVEAVHITNAEMAIRIGDRLERKVQAEELDDTWMSVTFYPEGSA